MHVSSFFSFFLFKEKMVWIGGNDKNVLGVLSLSYASNFEGHRTPQTPETSLTRNFNPSRCFLSFFFFSKSHTAPRLSTHHAHTLAVLCSKYHVLPSEKPPPKPITNDLLKYFNPKKLINQPDQASKLRKAIFLKKSLSLFSLSFSLTSLFAIMRSS